jgi:hypothetical protein
MKKYRWFINYSNIFNIIIYIYFGQIIIIDKIYPLFELNKSIISKLIKKHSNKSFMGFIKWKKTIGSKYINGDKINIVNNHYYCTYIKDINKFI